MWRHRGPKKGCRFARSKAGRLNGCGRVGIPMAGGGWPRALDGLTRLASRGKSKERKNGTRPAAGGRRGG